MVGFLRVTGDASAPELASTADEWCHAIARFLAVDVPSDAAVVVHPSSGVPNVSGRTLHLFCEPDGEADLAQLPHELVHLVVGHSPSRFLAEGLAVHVDAVLRLSRPAWPCYLAAPDLWVVEMRSRAPVEPLVELVAEADALHLGVAVVPGRIQRAWRLYVLAGSFTGHLFSRLGPQFWAGYRKGACWAGAEDLARLEEEWLDQLPASLGAGDRSLLARSRQAAREDLRAQPDRGDRSR